MYIRRTRLNVVLWHLNYNEIACTGVELAGLLEFTHSPHWKLVLGEQAEVSLCHLLGRGSGELELGPLGCELEDCGEEKESQSVTAVVRSVGHED